MAVILPTLKQQQLQCAPQVQQVQSYKFTDFHRIVPLGANKMCSFTFPGLYSTVISQVVMQIYWNVLYFTFLDCTVLHILWIVLYFRFSVLYCTVQLLDRTVLYISWIVLYCNFPGSNEYFLDCTVL